jgi:hypothetical protein
MRMIGPVGSYRELGVQDHLCWVHGDRRDYRPRLSDFFRDGLERGLRVAYLGSEDARELRELLGRVVDTRTLLPRKAVRVISFEEFYGAAEPADPAAVIKRTWSVRLSGGTPSPDARSCWSVTRRGIRCRRCAGIAANSAMR